MSRIRVYPFNLAETLSLPPNPCQSAHLLNAKPRIKREDLHLYLERGGLPGLFAIRLPLEREQALTDILDLILYRDARFAKWFDPDLGREILEKIAKLPIPNANEISTSIGFDARRIKRHIEVLKELFVIHEISPHRFGYGKSTFYLYDCAWITLLGGDHSRLIQTWFLNEQLSQSTYRGEFKWKIYSYFTQKNSQIDFVTERENEKKEIEIFALKILDQAHVRKTDTLIFEKFLEKSQRNATLICVGPFTESYTEKGILFFPFESVV